MKKTRILLSIIMTMALCMSFALTALAEEQELYTEAAITKLLQVPEGTEYPAMDFVFTVTPYKYNHSEDDLAKLPVIGAPISGTGAGKITISFDGPAAASPAETLEETAGNVSTYYLESTSLFAGAVFPNAGIYEYIIGETDSSYSIPSGSLHEAMVLSLAKYHVTVLIRENADKVPYIYHIGVVRITKEGGSAGTDKVDPTPGGDGEETFYSQMSFTNQYVRTNGAPNPDNPDPKKPDTTDPDPENPFTSDSTLNISKLVKGELGSQSMPFEFKMTINVPNLIPSYVLSYYKAYLVDASGVLDPTGTVDSTLIGTDTSTKAYKYIKFVTGSAVDFQLTHGQTLVFVNTPVGTTYNVEETAETGYLTTITVFYNSIKNAVATSLITAGLVGEKYNAADYTNDFGDYTPGGLNVNDLPFYGMILFAIGGLVTFVVIKMRKRNRG